MRACMCATMIIHIQTLSYISSLLSHAGEKIFPIVWEVIKSLELYDVPVTSLTSDGAKSNRRFYRLCQPEGSGNLPYKCVNPYKQDKDLYFFCDAPHLLKTTRNCFSNSFSHSKSRKMQVYNFLYYNTGIAIIITAFLEKRTID